MKYGKLSRRARRPDDAEGISLFPFLAVLICAAGLLIVLLVVIGRQARAQASQRAEAKQVEFHAGLKQKHEDVLWRTEQLKQSLTATQRQLTDERLVLGHLEDHSRELRGRLESLERAWKELNAAGNAAQSQAVESQLRELSAKIDRMKQQVDKARREVMAKQRSHAVVPYEGPYGTRRRPIYIECRADAVVLQPEGIEFKTPDFEGPLGPGNPLAVALRAAREYMLRTAQLDPAKAGEPYPLLLVRPLGITAYYAAREAMRSWESDFGYEMVDADWSLDFGAADPELKRVVIEEVELARMRQRRLAEAAPRYYRQLRESRGGGGEEKPQFTVTGNGVVVPYGGEVADEPSGESRYGYARRPASLTASGDGNSTGGGTNTSDGPSAGGAEGVSSTGDVANGEASMLGGGGSTPGRAVLPPLDGTAGASSGNPSGNPSGNSQNGSTGSQNGTSDGSMTGATGTMTGSSGVATSGSFGGAAGASPAGASGQAMGNSSMNVTGGSPSQTNASTYAGAMSGSASQSSGAPRRLGEWYPNQDAGEGQPGPPGSQASREKPRHRQESLAEKRGKDWAMPDGQPRATAVTQPIRIDCYADRLVLVPQRGLAGGRSVALGPQTRDAMDELVTAIWNYTEGWGMAGKGMYWRPVLHFYVYPGAEGRYRDVEDLLRDSGLPVEQKNQLQKP